MSAKPGKVPLFVKVVVVLAALGGIVLVGLFGLRSTAIVAPVTVGTAVDAVPGSVEVNAKGNLRELTSLMGGTVEWCEPLEAGRSFKAGEVLMRLDTTDLEREIEEAQHKFETTRQRTAVLFANVPEWQEARAKLDAALERSGSAQATAPEVERLRAELEEIAIAKNPERVVAQEALENVRRLFNLGNASSEQVKQAERALAALETRLRLAEFDNHNARVAHELYLKNKAIERERMAIKAASDGVVKESLVWKGALIGPGAVVATFYSNERLVIAKISEEDISDVKAGQPAKLRLLSYPNEEFDAKVQRILPSADESTQRYTVYLDVAIDPKRLVPNSTGEVMITVGERPNRPLIPRRALLNGNRVFVVKGGRLEERQIALGYVGMNIAEVVEGLAPDERVVVEQLDQFRDGQRVRARELN